ncbi:MAG TPA: MotA/TolQ/ExbB proton channel family protein [Methanosarcinaceae archaeon]|nr:MotA/TolQ/ExbB proton channel family protein [Methanosarcinaceae archaeon]
MDASSSIFIILYTVSTSLLYPVVLLILVFVLWALVSIGEFLSEYSKRHRDIGTLEQICGQVRTETGRQSTGDAVRHLRDIDQNHLVTSFANEAAQYLENNKLPELERLFGEYEVKMAARLEKTQIMSTVAPMLGLMGTLIPMGPALVGLSTGDIVQLADNLIIAFSTTVLGLFVGSVGFVLTIIRRRWYQYDLEDIEYVLESMLADI